MITNKRQFKCGDELDFQELCNEQLEKGVKAFVVSFENDDGHKRSSALFLHRSLLDGKRRSDNLSVCNEYVTRLWGHDVLPHAVDGYLSLVHHAKNPARLQGWAWRPSFTDSLDRLVSEVEALINFKRITVTVYDLDGNQQKESTPFINFYKPCDLSDSIDSMPAPKYKVGDRFVKKAWDRKVFTITRINKVPDGFVYIDETVTHSAYLSELALDNNYAKVRME